MGNIKYSDLIYLFCFFYFFIQYFTESLFTIIFAFVFIFFLIKKVLISIPKSNSNILICLFVLYTLIIGLIFNDFNSVSRDFLLFLNPILTLILGFLAASQTGHFYRFIKFLLLTGLFYSIYYLLFFDYNSLSNTIYNIRNSNIRPNYYSVISLSILLLFYKVFINKFSYFFIISIISIFILSILLSLSRIFVFAPLILLFFYIKISFRTIGYIIIIGSILMFSISFFNFDVRFEFINQFFDKLVSSSNEIKVSSYSTQDEINSNWRGFESYRALLSFGEFSLFNKIFGGGLGHTVQLGFFQKLDGQYYSEIQVLHNAYLMVLTKSGILGLIIFFILTIVPLVKGVFIKLFSKTEFNKIGALYFGCIFLLFIATFTAGGWLHRFEFSPIIFTIGGLNYYFRNENYSY